MARPRVSAERKREVNAAKMRRWRKKNPDKVKQYIMRYWVKKAIEQMQQSDQAEREGASE